jgi:hypothetical protein
MKNHIDEESTRTSRFHLGYLFHYPKIGQDEPFQLDICISQTPTEQHYDPKRVELNVVSYDQERVEHLKVTHPWNSRTTYRICAGVIRLIDRIGKVEEALTFGANLSIDPGEQVTCLFITSPAPIIKITNTTALNELLRDEIEILWAERRAHLLVKPGDFEKRLIKADPLLLYEASLNAMIAKFESPNCNETLDREALHYFQTDKARLAKASLIAGQESMLEDIL